MGVWIWLGVCRVDVYLRRMIISVCKVCECVLVVGRCVLNVSVWGM